MRLIHIGIDTMLNTQASPNFHEIANSLRTLLDDGFVLQVVREIINQPVTNLFQIMNTEEFDRWSNAGFPANGVPTE